MSRTGSVLARLCAAALLLAGATACGGDDEPSSKAGSSSSSSSTPSSSSSPTPDADGWVGLEDAGTGARFRLPRSVEPQVRTSAGMETRQYQVEVSKTLGVSVGFSQAPTEVDATYLEKILGLLAQQLRQAGAKDAKVSKVRAVDVGGPPARDATLTFTAQDGSKSYWRVRYIVVAPKEVMAVQVITFRPATDTTTPGLADQAFLKAVDGVELP